MVHPPASVSVVKSWAEKGVGRKRMPGLPLGPSANSQSCFHGSLGSVAKGKIEAHVATLSYSLASCKPHHSSCEVHFHRSGFCQGRL